MSIANIGLYVMIGVICALATGLSVWTAVQYRKGGFKVPVIIGTLAVIALTLVGFGVYTSGLSYGY